MADLKWQFLKAVYTPALVVFKTCFYVYWFSYNATFRMADLKWQFLTHLPWWYQDVFSMHIDFHFN